MTEIKEHLTKDDKLFIEESINFYNETTRRMSIFWLIILLIGFVILYYMNLSVFEMILTQFGSVIFLIIIWYDIFGKYRSRLKKDLIGDIKLTQEVTIEKTRKEKNLNSYTLSNGIKITDSEIIDNELDLRKIQAEQKFLITYPPNRKLILDVYIK